PYEYGTTPEAVIADATSLGLAVSGSKEVEGESLPGPTRLTTTFLDPFMETGAGAVYRTFSGVAHGSSMVSTSSFTRPKRATAGRLLSLCYRWAFYERT